ncbi:restriction endonuclease subunit S [Bradyrhizobium sp. HKCCYLRH2015]|uniref:restriction endonuclease subunit S n=1 Tax=Bradyrhizobium TaxID=374 RepID=UPI002915FE0E|nr:restriction endonuclease subunit S [Bradyrhizobium sp. SZCCHNR3003]
MSWPTVALSELTEKIGSGSTPRGGGETYKTSGIPLVRSMNVYDGEFVDDGLAYLDEVQASALDHVTLQSGDVLLNITGASVARVCRLPDRLAGGRVNQHVSIIRPKKEWLDADFLAHLLQAPEAKSRLLRVAGAGATREAITKAQIEEFKIPIPPLDEQRRIAVILDKADALRRKRRRAIELLDSFARSVFLEMFGDPDKPNNYEKRILGDLVSGIESGWSPTCLDRVAVVGEPGVLKLSAVTNSEFIQEENKALPAELRPKAGTEVVRGDILLCRKNTRELVGSSVYVWETRPDLHMSDLIFRLVPRKTEIDPIFLQAQLSLPSLRKKITEMSGGAAGSMPNVSKGRLRDLELIVPTMSTQIEFARTVRASRALKMKQIQSSAASESLFSSLQHSAFSGQL